MYNSLDDVKLKALPPPQGRYGLGHVTMVVCYIFIIKANDVALIEFMCGDHPELEAVIASLFVSYRLTAVVQQSPQTRWSLA